MVPTRLLGIAVLLLAGPPACAPGGRDLPDATLPEAALPDVRFIEPGKLVSGDPIEYRAITRADFLADAPPARYAGHAEQVGAFTAGAIAPAGEIRFAIEPVSGGGFVARPSDVVFRAEMDRSLSWWNDSNPHLPAEYVLQHEQIHFGITEQFAREVNARVQHLSARGDTPDAARDALQSRIESAMRGVVPKMLERQTEFDRATSGKYRPEVQERWYRELEAALAGN